MNTTHTFLIQASPTDVMEYMLSEAFVHALVQGLDNVSGIEEVSTQKHEDTITRTLRYQAPTRDKMPKFLKKYESKAPDFVYWNEVATWNLPQHTMSYTIVAEVPEHWQSYYTVSGGVTWRAQGAQTSMETTLSFDVNVFGFKRLIERALDPEVKRLMQTQGELVREHFA